MSDDVMKTFTEFCRSVHIPDIPNTTPEEYGYFVETSEGESGICFMYKFQTKEVMQQFVLDYLLKNQKKEFNIIKQIFVGGVSHYSGAIIDHEELA